MANDSPRVQSPTILVNGQLVKEQTYNDLMELRVEQSLQMPASASLRFRDPDFVLLDDRLFKVADKVEVRLPTAKNKDIPVFTGEITAIALDQGPGDRHELVISALDGGHRLAGATHIRSFQNQSYTDVVKAIAGENGLKATVDGGSWMTKQFEYLLQTGTDYAYLSELAEAAGLDWWVEDDKLIMNQPAMSAKKKLTWREDLSRFRVRFSSVEQADSVTVQGWDRAQQKPIKADDKGLLKKAAAVDVGTNAPFADDGHREAASLKGRTGGLTTATLPVASAEEAGALASAIAGRLLSKEVVARGEALGTPELKVGSTVEIIGMGDSVSGDYRLTKVEHLFGIGKALTTRFTAGGRTPSSLADLISAGPDVTEHWGRNGLVVGVVTNNNDPKNQGRVRVRFPSLSAKDEGGWARVVVPGGGAERGVAWLPEIDDEVVVGFDNGDLRFPLIFGGLWSAKNKPPEASGKPVADGKVVRRALTSRLGHHLEFGDGDKPAERHVEVGLAVGKTKFRVGEDKVDIESPKGNPITVRSGSTTIVVAGNGDVSIDGGNITIKAKQKLTLEAPDVEINADRGLKATSGGQAELMGSMTKIQASGMLELKGSMAKIN